MRFYRNELPIENETVMVRVREKSVNGFFVDILEYGNIEGFIAITEVSSRKRIRSLKKEIDVGREMPLMVLNLDDGINLSKRRVDPEMAQLAGKRYGTGRHLQRIGQELTVLHNRFFCDPLDYVAVMDKTLWNILENLDEMETLDTVYQSILRDCSKILDQSELTSEFNQFAIDDFAGRTTREGDVLETTVSLMIHEEDAVNVIKQIFTIDLPQGVKVYCQNSPLYCVQSKGTDSPDKIKTVVDQIQTNASQYSGSFSIVKENEVVKEGKITIKPLNIHQKN